MFLKIKSRLKPQIIINPESDRGRTGKRWQSIKEALSTFFKEYKYEFTEKPSHATEISRSAIKEGAELIVGVGGDGTMNEIANGFFENKTLINPETSLGIVPSGTGSDFSRSLNIPTNLKNAMEIITEAPVSRIDTGRVKYQSHEGEDKERFFLNITDFGIGGEVVHRMTLKQARKNSSSYLKSLVSTFIHYKNKKLRIKIDGQELPVDEYMVGAVANGRIFGKGMKIAPEAKLDDGFFDVVLVKGMKVLEFCRNVWRIYSGTHLSHPKIDLIRGRHIEVFPDAEEEQDVLIEVDGEQVGKVPVSFDIFPSTFSVIGNP